jgi:hypothetical protein
MTGIQIDRIIAQCMFFLMKAHPFIDTLMGGTRRGEWAGRAARDRLQ